MNDNLSELQKTKLKSWSDIKFFKPNEFDSPDDIDSGLEMNIELVKFMDKLRHDYGSPLKINSGYRTESHNLKVGGKSESAHTNGLAVDIECLESSKRFKIIQIALQNGVKRIGIAKTFIHLDFDLDKPQEVVWLY